MCNLIEHIERDIRARQQAILIIPGGVVMGPYSVASVEPTPTDDPDTEAVTVTLTGSARQKETAEKETSTESEES